MRLKMKSSNAFPVAIRRGVKPSLTETHVSWGSCNKPLGELNLLATSLWELVTRVAAMLSRASSSNPYSCYYAIVRGMGKRVRGGESWAWWRGESIVSVATMEANGKRNKTQHTRWRKQCSLFLLAYNENEDQVKMTCLLYIVLLKGGLTLKLP